MEHHVHLILNPIVQEPSADSYYDEYGVDMIDLVYLSWGHTTLGVETLFCVIRLESMFLVGGIFAISPNHVTPRVRPGFSKGIV